jgi:uncharacterized membrane protein
MLEFIFANSKIMTVEKITTPILLNMLPALSEKFNIPVIKSNKQQYKNALKKLRMFVFNICLERRYANNKKKM